MLHSSKDIYLYMCDYIRCTRRNIYIYMLHFIPLCIVSWWLEAKLIWGSHENSALHLCASEKNFCSEGCVSGTRILTERHVACLTWSATYPGRESWSMWLLKLMMQRWAYDLNFTLFFGRSCLDLDSQNHYFWGRLMTWATHRLQARLNSCIPIIFACQLDD